MKIGAVTIGQSPRVDIHPDVLPILGKNAELVECGCLDGMTKQQIEQAAPIRPGRPVFISRLNNGDSVTFDAEFAHVRLVESIRRLEREHCSMILVFCTGAFPFSYTPKVSVLFPNQIHRALIPLLTPHSRIITVSPDPLQVGDSIKLWKQAGIQAEGLSVSPYGPWEPIEQTARRAAALPGDLILLDCIGYTEPMKKLFAEITGKPVILPRTLLARFAAETFGLS